MATNIDKALYQLPADMNDDVLEAEPIEIEIETSLPRDGGSGAHTTCP